MSTQSFKIENGSPVLNVNLGVPQTVDPQLTDKRCRPTPLPIAPANSNVPCGMTTPGTTTPDSASRRSSCMLSDTALYCRSGPPSASSFSSSPGFLTSSSSRSSASSRRQSMGFSEALQYYSSALPLSPSPYPRRAKSTQQLDQYSLSETLGSNDQVISNFGATCFMSPNVSLNTADNEFIMAVEGYAGKSQYNSQGTESVNTAFSTFDSTFPTSAAASLSPDFTASFDHALSQRMPGRVPSYLDNSIWTSCLDDAAAQVVVPSQTTIFPSPSGSTPADPFGSPVSADDDSTSPASSSSDMSNHGSSRARGRSSLKDGKEDKRCRRKGRQSVETFSTYPMRTFDNKHACLECGLTQAGNGLVLPKKCFRRPEHLQRHKNQMHMGNETKYFSCKKCGKRLKARSDNMTAHLNKTHFHYGNTEKSGTNIRISLKESQQLGLRKEDQRWTELLEGKMMFGDPKTRFYKMMGYSIGETQALLVKSIAPEWEGPNDTTLDKFDPRWVKLREGTMTFEEVMDRGEHMLETEAEGLLGVTMVDSEGMGLRGVDPRWIRLDGGAMSTEVSDNLGVLGRNPVWTAGVGRVRRCKL